MRDPLAHRQLALVAMALDVFLAAPQPHLRRPVPHFGDEGRHALAVPLEIVAGWIDVRREALHWSGLQLARAIGAGDGGSVMKGIIAVM